MSILLNPTLLDTNIFSIDVFNTELGGEVDKSYVGTVKLDVMNKVGFKCSNRLSPAEVLDVYKHFESVSVDSNGIKTGRISHNREGTTVEHRGKKYSVAATLDSYYFESMESVKLFDKLPKEVQEIFSSIESVAELVELTSDELDILDSNSVQLLSACHHVLDKAIADGVMKLVE